MMFSKLAANLRLRNAPVLLQGIIIVLLFICHVCLSARGRTFPGQLIGYEQSSFDMIDLDNPSS